MKGEREWNVGNKIRRDWDCFNSFDFISGNTNTTRAATWLTSTSASATVKRSSSSATACRTSPATTFTTTLTVDKLVDTIWHSFMTTFRNLSRLKVTAENPCRSFTMTSPEEFVFKFAKEIPKFWLSSTPERIRYQIKPLWF